MESPSLDNAPKTLSVISEKALTLLSSHLYWVQRGEYLKGHLDRVEWSVYNTWSSMNTLGTSEPREMEYTRVNDLLNLAKEEIAEANQRIESTYNAGSEHYIRHRDEYFELAAIEAHLGGVAIQLEHPIIIGA